MARTHEERMSAQRLWRKENQDLVRAYDKASSDRRLGERRERRAEKAVYDREYKATHVRKDSKASQKAYDDAHREEKSRGARNRRLANLEKFRAAEKGWKALNPELVALCDRRRRAKKLAAGGAHTVEDTRRIRQAQKGKCAYCKSKLGRSAHLDHIKPISKGGSNAASNLQWLCAPCNHRKSAKDPVEFAQSLGMLL